MTIISLPLNDVGKVMIRGVAQDICEPLFYHIGNSYEFPAPFMNEELGELMWGFIGKTMLLRKHDCVCREKYGPLKKAVSKEDCYG